MVCVYLESPFFLICMFRICDNKTSSYSFADVLCVNLSSYKFVFEVYCSRSFIIVIFILFYFLKFLDGRYYDLVDPKNGILKKGREILLTGCYLRTAAEGSGYPRLLPTEYLVILLDEVTFNFVYCHSVLKRV